MESSTPQHVLISKALVISDSCSCREGSRVAGYATQQSDIVTSHNSRCRGVADGMSQGRLPIHHLHGARGLSLDDYLGAAANHVWRLSILGYQAAGSNARLRCFLTTTMPNSTLPGQTGKQIIPPSEREREGSGGFVLPGTALFARRIVPHSAFTVLLSSTARK